MTGSASRRAADGTDPMAAPGRHFRPWGGGGWGGPWRPAEAGGAREGPEGDYGVGRRGL